MRRPFHLMQRWIYSWLVVGYLISCSNKTSTRSSSIDANNYSRDDSGFSTRRPGDEDKNPPGYNRDGTPTVASLIASTENIAIPACKFADSAISCQLQVTFEGQLKAAAGVEKGTEVVWTIERQDVTNYAVDSIQLRYPTGGRTDTIEIGVALANKAKGTYVRKDLPFNMTVNSAVLFVSRGVYNGNLKLAGSSSTGLLGGDAVCHRIASTLPTFANYDWKAMLGISSTPISNRFGHIGTLRDITGKILIREGDSFVTKKGIFESNTIVTDETGSDQDSEGHSYFGTLVWFGSINGEVNDCQSFDSGSPSVRGFALASGWNWDLNSYLSFSCDTEKHIYCIGIPETP